MLGMVWIADVVTEVFIVRLRFVWVSVAKAVNFNRPIVYFRAKKALFTEELEKTFREGVKRLGTALEFGAKDRALPADPEKFGKPVAIVAGRDHTCSLSTSQALGCALLPVDEHIE
jgi:hypothetical protein